MLDQASTQNNEIERELDVKDLDAAVGGIIAVCARPQPQPAAMGDGSV